ncbi:MAG: 3D domain-containing protein [Pseudodesulfovibrio sp.]|nr:3D domain-containing protein [Pseudodesulfovibrio sp.]
MPLTLWGCSNDEFAGEQHVESDQYEFPTGVDGKVGKVTEKNGIRSMIVNASAYTDRPVETKKYAVGIAAWGDKLIPGMKAIAVSRDLIPLGLGHNAEVIIRGLSGKYHVLDKMNKRWEHKIDIFFGDDLSLAKKWGKRKIVISWSMPKS